MVQQGIPRRSSKRRILVTPPKETIKRLYLDDKLTLDDIAKKLNVSVSTVFRWMMIYNIPTRKMKYKKFPFSRNPNERAYLQGLCLGDFHARKHYNQILVEVTTTHPSMIKLFYDVFQIYGAPQKYPKYNKKTKRYEWCVYVLLDKSFEFLLSKQFKVDKNYFYSFLAAFFDCEGCLHIYNNHSYIGLTALFYNSNKNLLDYIHQSLKEDNFNPILDLIFRKGEKTTNNYFRGSDLWVVRLHTNKEVRHLMKQLPLKHREKINKCKIALATVSNKKWNEIAPQATKLQNEIKEEVRFCVAQAAKAWGVKHGGKN